MLKTLCGLTVSEIATSLLSNTETVAKKLYRAKEKIKREHISLDVPTGNDLVERLDIVLKAIYLLFYDYFKQSAAGTAVSTYHLEAAIASYHALAPSFETTNWQAIYYCYNLLHDLQPSPIIALNRAIALGYTEGAVHGIAALRLIVGLEQNPFYHTALGDFLLKNKDIEAALQAYYKALACTQSDNERRVIELKIKMQR
jgi:predicted RNA polymerase sigma factor